jgi:hypothetical protein
MELYVCLSGVHDILDCFSVACAVQQSRVRLPFMCSTFMHHLNTVVSLEFSDVFVISLFLLPSNK